MKKRNYKRIYKPGTLIRIVGSDCVFMSLGLVPNNNRQINSFNGIDIVKRKAVTRADGRARPANKHEQATYWNIMKEVIRQRNTETKEKVDIIKTVSDNKGLIDLSMDPTEFKQRIHAIVARYADSSKTDAKELQEVFKKLADNINPYK